MKRTLAFLLIAAAALAAKPKKSAPAAIDPVDEKLLLLDCPLMVKLTPKDKLGSALGFCLYTHTETRGIFASTACVGVLAEPDTQSKNAFYGSRGHWGVEGKCEKGLLEKKIADKEIDTTVNPITDIRQKRRDGTTLKLLRDDYGVWAAFERRTRPTP